VTDQDTVPQDCLKFKSSTLVMGGDTKHQQLILFFSPLCLDFKRSTSTRCYGQTTCLSWSYRGASSKLQLCWM